MYTFHHRVQRDIIHSWPWWNVFMSWCDRRCVARECDKQTRDTFQSSRLTEVILWVAATLQTLWWVIGGRRRSWGKKINCHWLS